MSGACALFQSVSACAQGLEEGASPAEPLPLSKRVATHPLSAIRAEHEALLKSHKRLALKLLGDTEETDDFLGEIASDTVENFPEWMK